MDSFRAMTRRTAAVVMMFAMAGCATDETPSPQAAGDDRAGSGRADGALHRAIAEATGNPYLVDLSDRIRHAVSLGFRAEPYSPTIRSHAVIEHAELADAVIRGDSALASEVAARHFSITEERLRALLARSGEAGAGAPDSR